MGGQHGSGKTCCFKLHVCMVIDALGVSLRVIGFHTLIHFIVNTSTVCTMSMCYTFPVFLLTQALGQVGVVTRLIHDGDVRVSICGHHWTMNPLCLSAAPGEELSRRSEGKEDWPGVCNGN